MFDKLKSILDKVTFAYIFVGEGEPYYVLSEAGVARRKILFEQEGKAVKIIKVSKADIGESFEQLLNLDGETVTENILVEKPKRNKKTK